MWPGRRGEVVELASMTHHLDGRVVYDATKHTENETGLPTIEALRFGVDVLMDALSKHQHSQYEQDWSETDYSSPYFRL